MNGKPYTLRGVSTVSREVWVNLTWKHGKGDPFLLYHNVAPAGAVAYFRDIHKLEKGDTLFYKTALGEREYAVSEVKEITEDDWSFLGRTEDNRLTLITCITGKPNMRFMAQALEV